jgi:hypothetical protein
MRNEGAGSAGEVLFSDLRQSLFGCIAVRNLPELNRAQRIAAPTTALLEQKFHLLVFEEEGGSGRRKGKVAS